MKNGEKKSCGVVVDYFSKKTYLFSLNSLRAEEFVEKFERKVIDDVGPPRYVVGDSAKQFLSMVMKDFSLKHNFILLLLLLFISKQMEK